MNGGKRLNEARHKHQMYKGREYKDVLFFIFAALLNIPPWRSAGRAASEREEEEDRQREKRGLRIYVTAERMPRGPGTRDDSMTSARTTARCSRCGALYPGREPE
ncbi:hypothetical protein AAFF_G00043900 [Aldrovandia affinis]|uniref:Uncharacterized protein n=1 Tax=Aldrovandia affinis TaxID=143900 RepID=A0AAD7WF00_9TELE|nr:hypothetical protein AAFF_G00043900 [Aldrovandia affinis]